MEEVTTEESVNLVKDYENISIHKCFYNKLVDCNDSEYNNIIYSVNITSNNFKFTRNIIDNKKDLILYANNLINGIINFSISTDKKTFIIYYLDNMIN
jgi:hypothetical protein